jgi:hypothetical protein
MHMLVETLCTCSCGMVLMMQEWLGYPYELVTARAIKGRKRIWVASRFLTTKIPSALLVAVVRLQHTRCPRFRRGTVGYGITHHQSREVRQKYGVFMRMHVGIPKLPKCICYAVHAQKQYFNLNHKVLSKTEKISSGLRSRSDLDWHEIFGPQNLTDHN